MMTTEVFAALQNILGAEVREDSPAESIQAAELTLHQICDLVLLKTDRNELIDLSTYILQYDLEAPKMTFAPDATKIIEKQFIQEEKKARRDIQDVENKIYDLIISILAFISIEIRNWSPNNSDLGESESSNFVKKEMRRYLAYKKRNRPSNIRNRHLEEELIRSQYQLEIAKRELSDQRGAAAALKKEVQDTLQAALTGIERRSKEADEKYNAFRQALQERVDRTNNDLKAASIEQERIWREFISSSKARMDDISQKWNHEFQENDAKIRESLEVADRRIGESVTDIVTYLSNADAAQLRLDELNNSLSTTEENLKAFKKAAEERAGQTQSREHWSRRVKISSLGFGVSAFSLLMLLVFVPLLGILNFSSVLGFMKTVSNEISQEIGQNPNTAQITMAAVNRLVLIGAPVALYFWLIRIIVRYNSMSLMLMDDAHQRRTMIDTYIHLIEHQVARTEDRAILLNAIFRPSPGQANDVEPPSFVDLVDRLKPSS